MSFVNGSRKQRILKLLNLEDTVTPAICAFVIEKSKGVFVARVACPFQFVPPKPLVSKKIGLHTWQQPNQPSLEEFFMSARNGDKSRFNRKRKQNIARRKHTRELLERAKKAPQSAHATIRA